MAEPKTLLTGEDLLRLPKDGRRYELLDGELVEMAPTNGRHARIEGRFIQYFNNFLDDHGGGEAMTGEPGIYLHHNPDHIRCPDVCVYTQGRVPSENEEDAFMDTIPDLVVEVISPGDRAGEVQQKVAEWLDAGVRLVWAAYPVTRTIVAYRSLTDIRTYLETDTIDADPVLPGFSRPVVSFFRRRA